MIFNALFKHVLMYYAFSAKSGRQRAAVPSATFVHYDTQPTKPHLVDKAKSESRLELLERESSQPERIKSNDKQDKNESCNEQNGNINNDGNTSIYSES